MRRRYRFILCCSRSGQFDKSVLRLTSWHLRHLAGSHAPENELLEFQTERKNSKCDIASVGDEYCGGSGYGCTVSCNDLSYTTRLACTAHGIPAIGVYTKEHCGHIWLQPSDNLNEESKWKVSLLANCKIVENELYTLCNLAHIPWSLYETKYPLWTIQLMERCCGNQEKYTKSVLLLDYSVTLAGRYIIPNHRGKLILSARI